jgi:hypothetical protein
MCGGDTSSVHDLDLKYYQDHFKTIANQAGDYVNQRMSDLQAMDQQNQQNIGKIIGMQMPELRQQYEFAQQQRQQYLSTTQPMMLDYMKQAATYDTANRRSEAMGQATASVGSAVDAQRRQSEMQLESMGVDPSQTRYQSLDNTMGIARAQQSVQAATQARQDVEARGLQMRASAIGMGQQFAANSQQAAQMGTQIAGQAGALGLQGQQTSAATLGTGLQWAGMQTGALSAAEAAKLTEWQAKANATQINNQSANANSAGIGSAIGTIGGGLIGGFASGGNPFGIMAGAGMGSKVGSQIG